MAEPEILLVNEDPIDPNSLGRFMTVDIFPYTGATAIAHNGWHGRMINFEEGCIVTIPAGLKEGFSCGWSQGGSDSITFVAGAGVTIQSVDDALETNGQYSMGGFASFGENTYRLYGPLT